MMTNYLSYPEEWLVKHNAFNTAKEISQQPMIWQQVWQQLSESKSQWQAFLQPLLSDPSLTIILTGAGSSAFAGSTLAPWLREHTSLDVHGYGSTEIVADPLQYLSPKRKTLLISYARSGNSPESTAVVDLANELVDDCYHLFITCNPDSALTKLANKSDKIFELVMPKGTHDLSFAMTSSISSMMMATILLLGFKTLDETGNIVKQVAQLSAQKLDEWQTITKTLAKDPIKRIIYVGSSCFTGLTKEMALKVLELTSGKIATRFDSTLGLRHGPKFMIDKDSLAVCLLSNDSYTRQYDLDLFDELTNDGIAYKVLALSGVSDKRQHTLSLNSSLNDIWLIFPYLLFGQMVGFEASLALGLGPDNPCPTGEVNRVVKGVNIYPFKQ